MAKMVKNPYEKVWAREENLYSKEISASMTKHLRSNAVQKKIDKLFSMGDSAAQIDWKTKGIDKATKTYRKELDAKMKSACKAYPGLMTLSKVEMGMIKGRFLPTVEVMATYAKQVKGGKIHYVTKGDTLRSVSTQYYGHEIYWQVIETANPKSWIEGAALEIPQMLVADDLSKSAASCASGGMHSPSLIAYPEVTADFSKDLVEHRFIVPCKGLPFTLLLTLKCTGKLNVGKTGTIPVSFKYNDYSAKATKALQGLKFSASAKSGAMSETLSVAVSGAGKKWTFAVAMQDGRKITLSAAPKAVNFSQSGFQFMGNLGFSLTIEVQADGSGLKIRTPEMAKEMMMAPIYLATAVMFFVAFRGMSPATASSLMINSKPGNGVIGYDEAGHVI